MAAVKVNDLVKEINNSLSQRSSSRKDEIAVMQAMLSDPTYEATVYTKDGPSETYNPCKDFRSMCASVISNVARVPEAEATTMMEDYAVKKSEATAMVGIAKEFIGVYLHTGRKLPLGGRERSDISLSLKEVPESIRPCPHKVGVNEDGSSRYSRNPTKVGAHEAIRVHAPCPAWVKGE